MIAITLNEESDLTVLTLNRNKKISFKHRRQYNSFIF